MRMIKAIGITMLLLLCVALFGGLLFFVTQWFGAIGLGISLSVLFAGLICWGVYETIE